MLSQTHTIDKTGLQSFANASPDYELAPIGIASMQEQAQKLAEYGRNGDIYVVHAAEGETVVPMEVLNANPKVRELLFNQMKEMGLDPKEFVVGNELNSINPDTGLPEFFFKSIFRSVKKAVKSVVKFVKKAAPIIIPLAAATFGIPFLGPAFGAGTFGASFLGGGIGSLAGGGSFKDALTAGLVGGGLAVGSTVIGNAFKGNMSFADSLKGSFTGAKPVYGPLGYNSGQGTRIGTQYAASPYSNDLPFDLGKNPVSSAISGPVGAEASGLASADFTGNIFSDPADALTSDGSLLGGPSTGTSPGVVLNSPAQQQAIFNANTQLAAAQNASLPKGLDQSYSNWDASFSGQAAAAAPMPSPSFVDKARQYTPFAVSDPVAASSASNAAMSAKAAELKSLVQSGAITQAGASKIVIEAGKSAAAATVPTLTQKYLPSLALAGGAAYLGGAFDEEEVKETTREDLPGFVPKETGFDLFSKDPERYRVQDLNPYRYDTRNPSVQSRFAADGGYMENDQFPRREMLVEGPGTERSDDIPAMLSDGEFVMNSRAVRGADPTGQGDRYAGAQNLYNMMRNFEMKA